MIFYIGKSLQFNSFQLLSANIDSMIIINLELEKREYKYHSRLDFEIG